MNQLAQETYLLAGSDKQKFISVVYERYGKKLYSYAINNWKLDTDIAWDLIYKTLYKVIDSVGNYEFNSEEKFASFVFKIFINYLRNHYRDTKNEREAIQMTSLEGHDHQQMEEEKTESKQMKALNEVLMEMEDWQRMLLLMRSEGRPYSEIAKYIDKPESQLKVYYQRLKEQITKKLNERS